MFHIPSVNFWADAVVFLTAVELRTSHMRQVKFGELLNVSYEPL